MEKKQTIVKIFGVCFFIVAFVFAFKCVYKVFSFKYGDGILGIEEIYELNDNSVDVLILGSSHAFEDINTGVLFDSYGIASYVLGGSVQPYWNTYYYLLEALKTQKPQLIILEAYASTFDFEYSDHSRIIKNNLGIKSLKTRYEALKVSAPEDSFDDYWFHYRLWHSRYGELGEADYQTYYETPRYRYFRGFGINFATQELERPSLLSGEEALPLAEKTEEYYRKIIELSIAKEIPLLIVVSPYTVNDKAQKQFNQSEMIAGEYGVKFINFNSIDYYDLMDLSFNMDFADSDHLNYLGNVKYTKLLGDIILEEYDVSNRWNNVEYDSWKMHSRDILGRVRNYNLREENQFSTYLELLGDCDNDYTVAVVINSIEDEMERDLMALLLGTGEEGLKNGSLYIMKENQIYYHTADLDWTYEDSLDGSKLRIARNVQFKENSFELTQSLMWNGREYMAEGRGIYFFVYDNFSQELVNICCFNKNFMDNIMEKNDIF